LVTNGAQARILRDVEHADAVEPVELVSREPLTHLRDIMSDKPGRSFASRARGRRSAMEPGSDPVLRVMQDFAAETAEYLEKHRLAGDFSRLAVLAEPKMLGVLRSTFPAGLWATVFLDLPINLTTLPDRELGARVLDLIRKNA
jgi:protein required for attachment to host cells